MSSLKEKIQSKAAETGFDFCGMATAEELHPEGDHYISRVGLSSYKDHPYLNREPLKRTDPGKIMPAVSTVIALMMNYYNPDTIPVEDNFIISRYARGSDYHKVLKEKLKIMTDFLISECGSRESRAFVDSAPLMEKAWASRCGLGWQGKHTILINPKHGSWFFIGVILTDLELAPDIPSRDQCGKCTKCIDACPTGALQPYKLDPSLCISNLTIEKVDDVPDEMYEKFGGRVYGCDACQEACPYNRFASATKHSGFATNPLLLNMNRKRWLELTEEDFGKIFQNTPVVRTGYERFMNNIRKVSRYFPH